MEKQENQTISYYAHEGMMARMERTNHRLWIVVIVLIVSLLATNLAWILYEMQWEVVQETTTQEVTQDTTGGDNHFVGGDYYGETDSKND